MRFLLDAQLAPNLVGRLERAGHQAIHVFDLLPFDASDIDIAREVRRQQAVLMSKDEDFVDLLNRGILESQLLWVRCGNMTTARLWIKMAPLLPGAVEALAAGERIVEIR